MYRMIDRHERHGWLCTRMQEKLGVKYETSSVIYLQREPIVTYEASDMIYLKKERYVSEIRNSLLKIIKEVRDNFEDFRYRQITLFEFRKTLESIKNDFKGDIPLFELIICLFYAVKNSYSEDLSSEQINTLETAIGKIDSKLTESDVDEIVEELISAGFNPLPKLEGLAEIYERQGEI